MGRNRATIMVMGLFLGLAAQAYGLEVQQSRPLTFYGVEMNRDNEVTLKEFRRYARSHGQANFVISESPFVAYEGTGDVILADYGVDPVAASELAAQIPGGAKVLEISVTPSAMSTKRAVGVYKLPLMPADDATFGDVWIQAGNSTPIRIEKNVVLDSDNKNIANLFKFVGFADREGALVYCLDQCTRYDLVSGARTAHKETDSVDAAGIHRSVSDLLTRQDAAACKGKMESALIQKIDKSGYYRGVCPRKGQDSVLEVRLEKDSGRWKVLKSTWEGAPPKRK